jgi:Flp pilus assembly protein TadD
MYKVMKTNTVLQDFSQANFKDTPNIFVIEDHNEAYDIWRKLALKSKTLLHIDAHIDFCWIQDEDPLKILEHNSLDKFYAELKKRKLWNLAQKENDDLIDIGNYIYPAIKENIVGEFYWVVPDPIWQSKKERKALLRLIKKLVKFDPLVSRVKVGNDRIETRLLNTKLVVTCLANLPIFNEKVLLDIDIDFLLTHSLLKPPPYFLSWPQQHWLLPEELVMRLKEKQITASAVTIAYSVEGGFTPLTHKYFGQELKLFFEDPILIENPPEIFTLKKNALSAWYEKKIGAAIQEYLAALKIEPHDPSIHYNLSLLYKEEGLLDRADWHFQTALELDAKYRTAYNNAGIRLEKNRKFVSAQEEYKNVLRLNPDNFPARLGFIRVLIKLKYIDAALQECKQLLSKDGSHAAAWSLLGLIYQKKKEFSLAVQAYEKSISLGQVAAAAHYNLGSLYAKISCVDKAINEYKKAAISGGDGPCLRLRLGYLYVKKKNFYKARREYSRFMDLCFKILYLYFKKIFGFMQ